MQQELAEKDPEGNGQFLGDTCCLLGSLLRDTDQYAEAEQRYRQALSWWERLISDFPAATTYTDKLAQTLGALNQLADSYASHGLSADAEKVADRCAGLRSPSLGPEP